MSKSLESITYLIKVHHEVFINAKACSYDEIIAQCTNFDRAVNIANESNAKIERHTEPLNNFILEELELYS